MVGRWDEVRAHIERVRLLLAALPPSPSATWPVVGDAWLALLQGRPDGPRLADEALALARQYDLPDLPTYLVLALAEVDLLAGSGEAARRRLEPLLVPRGRLTGAGYDPDNITTLAYPMLAWAAAELGDMPRADALLDEAIARARQLGYRPMLADGLGVRALLATRRGEWAEAEAALEESLTLWRVIPFPRSKAKALYVYGLLEAARDEPGRARERFDQALALLNPLGERLIAPHVERALAALSGG
jgi:tetratricopeptide (TPR) repeat protein